MNSTDRQTILQQVQQAHSAVEKAYLQHTATKNDPDWLEKRKFLLADLSLHMQATMQEPVNVTLIQRYLYSILNISHDFLPEAGLKETAEKLMPETEGI